MTEPSVLFWGFIIITTVLLQAGFHKSSFSHKLKQQQKKAFRKPVTYFIVWLLTTGPAARPKGRVTSAHGLLPRDYFISLHYFIISWVWVVLLAGLYSALLTAITLNSVQTRILAVPCTQDLTAKVSPAALGCSFVLPRGQPELPWPPCPPKWEGQLGGVWGSEEGEPWSFPKEVLEGCTPASLLPLDQPARSLP